MEKSDIKYAIREADGCAQSLPWEMLWQIYYYHYSLMYAAVRDINYIVESVILGEGKQFGGENVGLKHPAGHCVIIKDDVTTLSQWPFESHT